MSHGERATAGVTAAVCLSLLSLAAFLNPSSEGHGTHETLGLPACGFAATFDKPCATCGMTTAFSHATNGDLLSAALTQPFGALLAVSAASLVWIGAYGAWTGSPVWRQLGRLGTGRSLTIIALAAAAAWAYKAATWG